MDVNIYTRLLAEYNHLSDVVNPVNTSLTCSQCGVIDKKSRVSQSEFKCTVCGGDCIKDFDLDDCRVKAEQGDVEVQYNLGVMYSQGLLGVTQNHKEAVKWWRRAAEQGDVEAQHNLGLKYVKGQGVLQDYVMAHMYWNIAAVSGYKKAIKNRGIVEKKMTPSQLEEAQKLAREWIRTH